MSVTNSGRALETAVVLPYPPSLNNLYATVRGRKILSRDGRIYKQRAALILARSGLAKLTGDVCVSVNVYRPRRSGDLDNTLKALLDSITGIGWEDDSQVTQIVAQRFDDKHNPRVELLILPAGGTGATPQKGDR